MTSKDHDELRATGLLNQHGRIVGDHPWAGHGATIVRAERTLIGYGLVARLDPAHDVPPGQEAFIFEPRHWLPTHASITSRRRRRMRA